MGMCGGLPQGPLPACTLLKAGAGAVSGARTGGEKGVTCAGDLLVVQLVELADDGIVAVRVGEPPLSVLGPDRWRRDGRR